MLKHPRSVLYTFWVLLGCSTPGMAFCQSVVSGSVYDALDHGSEADQLPKSLDLDTLALPSTGTGSASVPPAPSIARVEVPSLAKSIPSAFISLGNRPATYGIVVEKDAHRLTVFKLEEDGSYAVTKTYRAITGKERGDKKYSGDNRTPEGIYFVVGQKQATELFSRWGKRAVKYGPRAFVLNYPNLYDSRSHKTGFGIWIHGVDRNDRILTPFDTEGCVALTNPDILDVSRYISSWETPVVIVDKMQTVPVDSIQGERSKVLDMLEVWRQSWETSNMPIYSGFYSDAFSSLGKSKQQWEDFKKNLAQIRDNSIQVQISEPKILAFKNQLLVEFFQKYTSKKKSDFGRKFLYLKKEGEQFKIIAEQWYPVKNQRELEVAVLFRKGPKPQDNP